MHRKWGTILAPAAVVAGLLAAACGSGAGGATDGIASAGDGAPARSATGNAKVDPEQAGLDFARCMRDHGVDVPDPQAGGGGAVVIGGPGTGDTQGGMQAGVRVGPPAGFEEAHAACGHILEDLIGDGLGPVDPASQDRALRFARCMRDNGIDMPDPDAAGGGPRIALNLGPGPDSEKFRKAQEACGGLYGSGGGFGVAPLARS